MPISAARRAAIARAMQEKARKQREAKERDRALALKRRGPMVPPGYVDARFDDEDEDEDEELLDAAGELVERARNGDQNAMALISAVGQGRNPRARKSAELIRRYSAAHPAPKEDRYGGWRIGNEAPRGNLLVCGYVLANRQGRISRRDVDAMASRFGSERTFFQGYRSREPADGMPQVYYIGHVVGLARRIQGVRLGRLPISALCPVAGWEAGE